MFRLYSAILFSCLLFCTYPKASEFYSDTPFQNAKGEDTTLSSFAGSPIVLLAWKKSCAFCRTALSSLDELASAYPEVIFLPLATDINDKYEIRKVYTASDIRHLGFFTDRQGTFTTAAGLLSSPLLVIYDKQGNQVKRLKGNLDLSSPAIRLFLDSLLAAN